MPQRFLPDEVGVPFTRLLHELALDAPLAALEHAVFLHELVHDLRALAISQARLKGHSWRTIAAALDLPPSTVQRRYRTLDPRPPE